jgi:hypothetical protein
MRATLFLSSLFAVSLIGGAALAERPSADGGESRRPVRDHKISELRPREASTVREHTAPAPREKSAAREPRVLKEAPNRGDNVDRSYAARAAVGAERVHQTAGASPKAVNQAYLQARNCSDLNTDCAKIHGKPAGNTSESAVAKKDDDKQHKLTRARTQEMVDKLHKMMCERHAAACADYL